MSIISISLHDKKLTMPSTTPNHAQNASMASNGWFYYMCICLSGQKWVASLWWKETIESVHLAFESFLNFCIILFWSLYFLYLTFIKFITQKVCRGFWKSSIGLDEWKVMFLIKSLEPLCPWLGHQSAKGFTNCRATIWTSLKIQKRKNIIESWLKVMYFI